MLITRITLENIKSYRRATVELGAGTTAIRGHNGAGKSTLVEAIGFALFDFLPYARNQFIREGEKAGKVIVAFVSAADERLYEVERRCMASGGGAWFVYDPELGGSGRIAEGKDDVVAFLRQHLGVESNVTLPDLFDNAIAVQQGTFTADFLMAPGVRKKKFDTLLQIEDYRKAADTLRETERHLKDTLVTHDKTIERLTAQTADLPTWLRERGELQTALVTISLQQSAALTERAAVAARYNAAQARQIEIAQLDQERERRFGLWQMALAQAHHAEADAERAEKAVAICAQALPNHQRHLAATTAFAQAQADERVANTLQLAASRAEQAMQAATAAIQGITQRLAEAEAAARERDRLAPLVARQQTLEDHHAAALQAQQRLTAYQKDRAQLATELEKAQQDLRQIADEIGRLEALKAVADQHVTRKAELDDLKAREATLTERQRTRVNIAAQLERQRKLVAVAQRAALHAEQQVAQARAYVPDAAQLPARENELALLERTIATLQADIEHADASMNASQGGMCPFLKEPCQNMVRHGLTSLEEYFGDQIAQHTDALMQHEQQRDELIPVVQRLRGLASQVDRLGELEHATQAAQSQAQSQQDESAHLQQALAAIDAAQEDAAQLAALIKDAAQRTSESAQAERKYAQLPVQLSRQAQATELIARHTQRLVEREQEIAAEQQQVTQIATLAAELQALGNPRQRHTASETHARQAEAIRAELATQTAAQQAAQEHLSATQQQLLPFASLGARIALLQTEIAQTASAHDDYLRHEAEAQRAPEARQRAATAQAAANASAAEHAVAHDAHATATATFDHAALDNAQRRLSELDGVLAGLHERQQASHRQIVLFDGRIAEAEARLTELQVAQAAHAEADGTLSLLTYGRDTIKEAGPFVMRAWLQRISGEANRIFGEIIGDRAATLSWQDDYDIVLRVGANERHFAQLSGGEQMSAALAVRLALLHRLTRSTLVIFDEPTQNMDGARRANLADQIRRVRDFEQVLVISHDDTFEEGLDSVVWVQKDDGASRIDSDQRAALTMPALLAVNAETWSTALKTAGSSL